MANTAMIFETIQKGLDVISGLWSSGKKIEPAVRVLYDLATSAQSGPITDAQLNAAEEQLDTVINDFNEPMG